MKILAALTVIMNIALIGLGLWKHDWSLTMGSLSIAFWAGMYLTGHDA